MEHINLLRSGECNRCGQCCGADNIGAWSETWPEEFFGYTQEQLESSSPIPALFGVPNLDHLSGEIDLNGYTITYYWYKGLRKSRDNAECPFLVYENEVYSCILYELRYELWIKNCQIFPSQIKSSTDARNHGITYPKCSYRWIPEDEIK